MYSQSVRKMVSAATMLVEASCWPLSLFSELAPVSGVLIPLVASAEVSVFADAELEISSTDVGSVVVSASLSPNPGAGNQLTSLFHIKHPAYLSP